MTHVMVLVLLRLNNANFISCETMNHKSLVIYDLSFVNLMVMKT